MYDFHIQISQSLRDLLEQTNPSLEGVILDESCQRSYRGGYETLEVFLVGHSADLVTLALDSPDKSLSSAAFGLITSENKGILASILSQDLLQASAEKIFSPECDPITLNRFATITQLSYMLNPDQAKISCPYLVNLIPYCFHRNVLSLYEAILGAEERAQLIQNLLKKENFTGNFLDLIASAPDQFADNPEDPNLLMFLGFFRLAPIFASSPILKDEILNEKAIQVLCRDFSNPPLALIDAQWSSIASYIPENLLSVLEPRIPQLLSYITPNWSDYKPHQVAALELLSRMLPSETARKDIPFHQVAEELAKIISNFPHHTFAHRAITSFINGVLQFPEPSNEVLKVIIPLVSSFMHDDSEIELRAFSWKVISQIKQAGFAGSFGDVAEAKFTSMNQIEEQSYGGELPPPPQPSEAEDDLAKLTPEQMMALLRFLVSGGGDGGHR